MPAEDNVQVVSRAIVTEATDNNSLVIDVGARGQAVELLAIHYNFRQFNANETQYLLIALSSNPEHELVIPATAALFLSDASSYGFLALNHLETVGAAGVWQVLLPVIVVPLYGLVRPRRQILMWRFAGDSSLSLRADIYYRPVSLNKTELDSLNLKYGKYRRR